MSGNDWLRAPHNIEERSQFQQTCKWTLTLIDDSEQRWKGLLAYFSDFVAPGCLASREAAEFSGLHVTFV